MPAQHRYVYEPDSFRPLALIQNGETYHYHLDHLGTPRELTKDNGELAWQARYRTYGSVALKPVEEIDNPIRFQGQYFDEETGLHYNRHRYYNPETGQFTTQDPIGLLGGTNCYQYAPNPTGWVDPLGLTAEKEDPSRQLAAIAAPTQQLALPAPKRLTPEMPGASIVSCILPPGFRYKQAVSLGQNSPGKFGTTDDIPDVDYVRNELAVIPSFKPTISGYREVVVVRPVRAQISTVGPQTEGGVFYPGGGSQIDVLEYDPYDPYVKFDSKENPLK